MDVLAIMGSPRPGGNTDLLVESLLKGASSKGAATKKIRLYKGLKITPCIECGACDETGQCILEDDVTEIYRLMAQADAIVLASPVFFYNITTYTQAIVERAQAPWVAKYRLDKGPFGGKKRIGIFVSVGATKGKRLFDGILLVIRYFFDAISADFKGALLYKGVEKKAAIGNHPVALQEARMLGEAIGNGKDVSTLEFVYKPR